MSITIRSASARAKDRQEVSRCPDAIEETTIESCGFVEFAGLRWRRIVGQSDIRFIDFAAVSESKFFRLIGFPEGPDADGLQQVESLLRKAEIE